MPPWGNRLKAFEVCRCDQVWVGDRTDVHLKAPFVYVSLLMDVCTRKIRGWRVSQHLTQPLTFRPLEQETLRQSGSPEIHHSDQGVQSLSKAYLSTLRQHGVELSVARSGCPWENGYAERWIRTLKSGGSLCVKNTNPEAIVNRRLFQEPCLLILILLKDRGDQRLTELFGEDSVDFCGDHPAFLIRG